MDRLEAMAILIDTIECGSMSAASRKLKMPVTTLSRKLNDLEEHLGTRLLTRSTRRLELTDAGVAYVKACRRILEDVAEAEREASGEYLAPRGELVVTASLAFGRRHVLPIVNEFLALHPQVTVRLGLSDQRLDLLSEHVDLAVRIGRLPDSNLVARRVADIRWAVVGSPEFLAAHGVPRSPEDLREVPCVGVDFLNLDTTWCFRRHGEASDYRVPIQSRLSVSMTEAAIDAAIAGVGLAQVLRYQATDAIDAGTLRTVLDDYEPGSVPVSILYLGGGRMPLKTRSFLDFAAPRLQERLT
ncbi:LysR family transcriptional regulator [Novosphingobium sp. 9U]|uniref:LysR family transcriptional regulator n=1 Tax=Novosphingobium sp. 9U TaxID=2653158 RepID=UPI0012F0F37B|nr:LysR family transcriptional regulator [Novosphingobium sp. 9U]VWX49535.1 LysR family transcriptional regulator [Novosphingobium sp. 9U]